MAQKKKPHLLNIADQSSKKRKKEKQPTQKTPMQAVMVMGESGKLTMQWRPW